MPARTTTIGRSDARRRLIVAVTTFLLVSFLVIRTSDAAFTATYTNDENEFATATIDLDGSPDIPLFGVDGSSIADAGNLYPGSDVEACIDIVYTGSLDAADLESVVLAVGGAPAGGLADELEVTVDVLDGDCDSGTSDNVILTDATLSAVGVTDSGWTPSTDGDTRGFRFTVDVTDDAEQNDSLDGVTITWSLETSS